MAKAKKEKQGSRSKTRTPEKRTGVSEELDQYVSSGSSVPGPDYVSGKHEIDGDGYSSGYSGGYDGV